MTDYERGYRAGIEAAAKVNDDLAARITNTIGNPVGTTVDALLLARDAILALAMDAEHRRKSCSACGGTGDIRVNDWMVVSCVPCNGTGRKTP